VGYSTGGGGALLTDATAYDPTSHVSVNARALIARAAGTTEPAVEPSGSARLALPPSAYEAATRILGDGPRPWIGIHASGGRQSKQWHLDRFAAVARQLGSARDATVVLTGAPGDRPLVDALLTDLGQMRVVDAAGQADLPTLAALLSQLDVFVTGDTGPMHLAAAVGTPIVALFGPSQPARYGPLASVQRVVRVDLPCSPCGQVRLPPDRCRGHVPDCMDGISVSAVCAAVSDVLDTAEAAPL
jgi:ADP-heptose:LPS heptosyltransferase